MYVVFAPVDLVHARTIPASRWQRLPHGRIWNKGIAGHPHLRQGAGEAPRSEGLFFDTYLRFR
jgi:hypothetical protein